MAAKIELSARQATATEAFAILMAAKNASQCTAMTQLMAAKRAMLRAPSVRSSRQTLGTMASETATMPTRQITSAIAGSAISLPRIAVKPHSSTQAWICHSALRSAALLAEIDMRGCGGLRGGRVRAHPSASGRIRDRRAAAAGEFRPYRAAGHAIAPPRSARSRGCFAANPRSDRPATTPYASRPCRVPQADHRSATS